jgi:small subunit ribosomal protein S17
VATRGARRAATPEERQAERNRKAAQRRAYRQRLKARRAEQAGGSVSAQPELERPEKTGHRKVRLGVVVSDKADKTITVRIDVARRHRRYQKTIRSSNTLHAHDERNEAGTGDLVRVVESRPLSRTKRWRLDEVLEKAR